MLETLCDPIRHETNIVYKWCLYAQLLKQSCIYVYRKLTTTDRHTGHKMRTPCSNHISIFFFLITRAI